MHLIPREGGEFEENTQIYQILRQHDEKLIQSAEEFDFEERLDGRWLGLERQAREVETGLISYFLKRRLDFFDSLPDKSI